MLNLMKRNFCVTKRSRNEWHTGAGGNVLNNNSRIKNQLFSEVALSFMYQFFPIPVSIWVPQQKYRSLNICTFPAGISTILSVNLYFLKPKDLSVSPDTSIYFCEPRVLEDQELLAGVFLLI
uniref:Uncharacterized protein n=1 Tax=Pipistrellus kuhlii TaxID=59472 RepID=A0A7J8B1U4_PIPKU|nr:hypothetical protein mPipKuh1_007700 [Pipistrellus kuhlii]